MACYATLDDFKEQSAPGPLLDAYWKCRQCGKLPAAHTHSKETQNFGFRKYAEGSKAGICFTFQKTGRCDRGDCRFSHEGYADSSVDATNICYEFQSKGSCARGSSCRFVHSSGKFAAYGSTSMPQRLVQCRLFLKGECTRGETCKFSHGEVSGGYTSSRPNVSGRMGPGVCYPFQQNGHCERGDSCRYVHESAAEAPRRGICFGFSNGSCVRGSSCRFSHEAVSENEQVEE